jgi:hypothetical protein
MVIGDRLKKEIPMIPIEYKIPPTLEEGAKYSLMEKKEDGSRLYSEVTFISYSTAPVFVYIKNSSGRILYVLREELFEKGA